MIELTCPTCKQVFKRRGARRGGKPDCNDCRNAKEAERAKYKPRVAV